MYAHGTYAKYKLDDCRCESCIAAGAAYRANRNRAIAYGTWKPYVDAAPVRQHIQHLRAHGLGIRQIAHLSGIDRRVVGRLVNGRHAGDPPIRNVRPATAQRILAVQPTITNLAPCAVIDSTGSLRRLQALVYCGWSITKLARRLGMETRNYSYLMQSKQVTVAKATVIRDLYDELWNQAPPQATPHERSTVTRARRYARAHGWVSPLAWDDDAIDDPAARPNVGERVPKETALTENCEELLSQGYTIEQAAARLGVTRGYLDKLRRRGRDKAVAA